MQLNATPHPNPLSVGRGEGEDWKAPRSFPLPIHPPQYRELPVHANYCYGGRVGWGEGQGEGILYPNSHSLDEVIKIVLRSDVPPQSKDVRGNKMGFQFHVVPGATPEVA